MGIKIEHEYKGCLWKTFFLWYWKNFKFFLKYDDVLEHIAFDNNVMWRGYSIGQFKDEFGERLKYSKCNIYNKGYNEDTKLYEIIVTVDRSDICLSPFELLFKLSIPYIPDELKFKFFYENNVSNIF